MSPEAQRILDIFRSRDLRSGGFIHFTEFGDAIIWEAGFVRDEPIREALRFLISQEFVHEMAAGLKLAQRGEAHLYPATTPRFGARVYSLRGRLLIKQTVLRGTPSEYVIDEHRERHVAEDDDTAIANAIRDAVHGQL